MNHNIITKKFTKKIWGKNGPVQTFFIQRHKPDTPMMFIKLKNDNFLFCQENHPLIVFRKDKFITIDAKDVQVCYDRIYSYNILENEKIVTHTVSESPQKIINALFYDNEESIYVKKRDKYTIQLDAKFIYFNVLKDMLDYIKDNESDFHKTKSFNLISQLKVICDIVGYKLMVSPLDKEDGIDFYFSISKNRNYKFDKMETKDNLYTVSCKSKMYNWNSYVYDISTDTKEFLINCIQTHNSFHTGGAVSVESVNIIKLLMENVDEKLEPKISKLINQIDSDLYAKSNNVMITINNDLFRGTYAIEETDESYKLFAGHFSMIVNDIEIPITIEKQVIIYKTENVSFDNNLIFIHYNNADKIMTVLPSALDPVSIARSLDSLFGGKMPYEGVLGFYKKLYKILGGFSKWDSVHLEVIISNLLRDATNTRIPARLSKGKFDPIVLSYKNLPSTISWGLALSFENFSKGIQTGLTTDRGPETQIEKVFFGLPLKD